MGEGASEVQKYCGEWIHMANLEKKELFLFLRM
jgi:hypothetical protein